MGEMETKHVDGFGALSSQDMERLLQSGALTGVDPINMNPSSLDLSISSEGYRVEGLFLPKKGETVRDVLAQVEKTPHDLFTVMERDVTYVFRLNEKCRLPSDVYGYCNPKSTTGRNDVHVRVIADGVSRYDALAPAGWGGELWIAIIPRSFPIRISERTTLSQLRLFNKNTRFSEAEMSARFGQEQLLWSPDGKSYAYDDVQISDRDGCLILTIDLAQEIVGYECRGTQKVLDFSKGVRSHMPDDFFEPIRAAGGKVHLKKGSFYILSSYEAVRVPPTLACAMAPMDERSGEFRSHYAGFIDPGWGYGKGGEGRGRPLTLEVRPFEDIVIRHNQPIAKIVFEQVTQVPNVLYDTKASNYLVQNGPRLSKHFKI